MAIPVAAAQFVALTGAVTKAIDTIEKSLSLFDDSQKVSLALGRSLTDTKSALKPSLDGLRGSIDNKLSLGFAALDAGLRGTVNGVLKLANQQQLTNQEYKKTVEVFSKLQSTAGIQNESLNTLSLDILRFSRTYGIASEKLIESLNNLKNLFPVAKILGFGEEIAYATTKLTADVGSANIQAVNEVLQTVLKPGVESLGQLGALGASELRSSLLAAKGNSEEFYRILREGIVTVGNNFNNLAGGSNATLESIGILGGSLGESSYQFSNLADLLQNQNRIQKDTNAQYEDTISTLTSEVYSPLKEAFLELAEQSLPALKTTTQVLTTAMSFAAKNIEVTFMVLGTLIGGLALAIFGLPAAITGAVLGLASSFGILSVSTENAIKNIDKAVGELTLTELEKQKADIKAAIADLRAQHERDLTESMNLNTGQDLFPSPGALMRALKEGLFESGSTEMKELQERLIEVNKAIEKYSKKTSENTEKDRDFFAASLDPLRISELQQIISGVVGLSNLNFQAPAEIVELLQTAKDIKMNMNRSRMALPAN